MALDNAYIDSWTPLGDFAIIGPNHPALSAAWVALAFSGL